MKFHKLSIITINRNNAAGLRKTIESVMQQTVSDIEYIVIDGNSNDGSVDVIRQYEKSITYWVSEPDRGIYHAMNKGIRQATGTYCQFLNSGDYLLTPNVTEQMLHDMPPCSILYGNKIREINGRQVVQRSYAGRPITLLDLYRSTIFHATAYIKRSLFDRYGLYDESLKIVSDWKFYLIAVGLHNEPVAYRDLDMVWFDTGGISSTQHELDAREREQVLQEVLPAPILADYREFACDGIIIKRLKQSKPAWLFVINLYRALFRIDKLRPLD